MALKTANLSSGCRVESSGDFKHNICLQLLWTYGFPVIQQFHSWACAHQKGMHGSTTAAYRLFPAALFIVPMSTTRRMDKLWHLRTVEYLTLRRNTLQQHTYISKTSQLIYGLIGGELYWMREAEGPRVLVIIPAHLWFVLVSICVSASLKNLLTIKKNVWASFPEILT